MAKTIEIGPYSAYAIAVKNGFSGTEQEWLASLVGPQGPQGASVTGAKIDASQHLIITVHDPATGGDTEIDAGEIGTTEAVQAVQQAIQQAGQSAVSAVESTGSTQQNAVTSAGTQAVSAIGSAQQAAVQQVQQAGAESITSAQQEAEKAASSATQAGESAQDAKDAADRAAIESQKAMGFRTYFGGQVVPDANGDLDPSRPMSTPTAASVTIKARGDRIAGLTMAGKTTQAGTGDPSPENIRMISGVGMYDQMVVLDGSSDEVWTVSAKGGSGPNAYYAQYSFPSSYPALPFDANTEGNRTDSNHIPSAATGNYVYQGNTGICCFTASGNTRLNLSFRGIPSTVSDLRTYLSQHPLAVWYRSVDYAKSTGPFYTVVELSDDPYRAVGFELTQPLFDGDSLKVGGKSGFDQMVVLDGSENWIKESDQSTYDRYSVSLDIPARYGEYATTGAQSSNWLREQPTVQDTTHGYGFNIRVQGASAGTGVYIGKAVADNVTELKSKLANHPLIIFYRSVDYTEENDIPVALETHQRAVQVLNGTESIAASTTSSGGKRFAVTVGNTPNVPSSIDPVGDLLCSHYKPVSRGATDSDMQGISFRTPNQPGFYIVDDRYTGDSDATNFKAYLAAQYSAGTPVTIVYELATPVSYARPVPTMIAQPGEDGTFTVTGENSLSVLLKAFQDGGDAATIEGHTWADILAAIQAATASTANALLEEKTNV